MKKERKGEEYRLPFMGRQPQGRLCLRRGPHASPHVPHCLVFFNAMKPQLFQVAFFLSGVDFEHQHLRAVNHVDFARQPVLPLVPDQVTKRPQKKKKNTHKQYTTVTAATKILVPWPMDQNQQMAESDKLKEKKASRSSYSTSSPTLNESISGPVEYAPRTDTRAFCSGSVRSNHSSFLASMPA
jgi:hypothetical protein